MSALKDLEDAMTRGELSSFLESMGISTDDVWTGGGVDDGWVLLVTWSGWEGKKTPLSFLDGLSDDGTSFFGAGLGNTFLVGGFQ